MFLFFGSEVLQQISITLSQIEDLNIKFRISIFLHIHLCTYMVGKPGAKQP